MVKCSHIDLKEAEGGDNVAVAMPMVDIGRGDPRNILKVVVHRYEQDVYRIAVKTGILSTKYSRNRFDLSAQKLLRMTLICTHTTKLEQSKECTS